MLVVSKIQNLVAFVDVTTPTHFLQYIQNGLDGYILLERFYSIHGLISLFLSVQRYGKSAEQPNFLTLFPN
jgi:hypothetical protein